MQHKPLYVLEWEKFSRGKDGKIYVDNDGFSVHTTKTAAVNYMKKHAEPLENFTDEKTFPAGDYYKPKGPWIEPRAVFAWQIDIEEAPALADIFNRGNLVSIHLHDRQDATYKAVFNLLEPLQESPQGVTEIIGYPRSAGVLLKPNL